MEFDLARLVNQRVQMLLAIVSLLPAVVVAQHVQVYDGKKFYRVDDERLRTLTIREWQIRLYKTAADHAAGRSWGTISRRSADACLEELRKQREEYVRFLRHSGGQDDGTGGGWRFVSQPYAVVDRGALTARTDAADDDRQQQAREAEARRQADAERKARQEEAAAQQRQREQQVEQLRRQAEDARREREQRMRDIERKAEERRQNEAQARILDRTVARLEQLQTQANAINSVFTQLSELLQAQVERDALREEIREAKREEERARREAEREERDERERLERLRLEQRMEEREAAREAADDAARRAPAPTPSSPAGVRELGDAPLPMDWTDSGPAAPPGGRVDTSAGTAPSSPAPRPSADVSQPPPQPPTPKFAEYGRLFDGTAARGAAKDAGKGTFADVAAAAERDEAAVLGGLLSNRSAEARRAVDDGAALRSLLDDAKLAQDAAEQVRRGEAGSDAERGVLDRLFDRYTSERDARIAGDSARGVATGRALEDAFDRWQQANPDRIPETVRAEGDAWRMLFARGASGDLAGHVKGHVEFAERWVFDRIDANTATPPPAATDGGRSGAPARLPSRSAGPLPAAEREAIDAAQRATRAAAAAGSLRERSVHLRQVLRATAILPTPPAARRSVLYLRAAAAVDLADPVACREVRAQLRADRADNELTDQERALLRALEDQCK